MKGVLKGAFLAIGQLSETAFMLLIGYIVHLGIVQWSSIDITYPQTVIVLGLANIVTHLRWMHSDKDK